MLELALSKRENGGIFHYINQFTLEQCIEDSSNIKTPRSETFYFTLNWKKKKNNRIAEQKNYALWLCWKPEKPRKKNPYQSRAFCYRIVLIIIKSGVEQKSVFSSWNIFFYAVLCTSVCMYFSFGIFLSLIQNRVLPMSIKIVISDGVPSDIEVPHLPVYHGTTRTKLRTNIWE